MFGWWLGCGFSVWVGGDDLGQWWLWFLAWVTVVVVVFFFFFLGCDWCLKGLWVVVGSGVWVVVGLWLKWVVSHGSASWV